MTRVLIAPGHGYRLAIKRGDLGPRAGASNHLLTIFHKHWDDRFWDHNPMLYFFYVLVGVLCWIGCVFTLYTLAREVRYRGSPR